MEACGGVVVGVGEPVGGCAEGLDEVVDAFGGSVGAAFVVPVEGFVEPVNSTLRVRVPAPDQAPG